MCYLYASSCDVDVIYRFTFPFHPTTKWYDPAQKRLKESSKAHSKPPLCSVHPAALVCVCASEKCVSMSYSLTLAL